MSIKSFLSKFTLAGEIKRLSTQENIKKLAIYIREQIITHVDKQMNGDEKKEAVDAKVVAYIKDNFKSDNTYINFAVNFLVQYEPQISQYIYNLLEDSIEGLTK